MAKKPPKQAQNEFPNTKRAALPRRVDYTNGKEGGNVQSVGIFFLSTQPPYARRSSLTLALIRSDSGSLAPPGYTNPRNDKAP